MSTPSYLQPVKDELDIYYNLGGETPDITKSQYMSDVSLLYTQGKNILDTYSNDPNKIYPTPEVLLIFDLDDSTVTTIPKMKENDYGAPMSWVQNTIWTDQFLPQISPIWDIYSYARPLGYSTVIITSRPESTWNDTFYCIQHAGYQVMEGVYLKPDDNTTPTDEWKESIRLMLIQESWAFKSIIMNFGDQSSDFYVTPGNPDTNGTIMRLPNYCYGEQNYTLNKEKGVYLPKNSLLSPNVDQFYVKRGPNYFMMAWGNVNTKRF